MECPSCGGNMVVIAYIYGRYLFNRWYCPSCEEWGKIIDPLLKDKETYDLWRR